MHLEKNGKIITKVKFNKKDVIVYFDDESNIKLSNNTFAHFYLYKGKKVEESELNDILFENEISSTKAYVVRLFSKKQYSKKEVVDKLLKKKCSKKIIEKIIAYLEEFNYLNEKQYLLYLIDEYKEKKYGKNKIIFLLKNKGIEEKLINSIEFDEDEELESAKESLEDYCISKKDKSYIALKSLGYAYLINRGFSSSIASKAIESIHLYIDKDNDKEILLKSLEKYVIIHQVDLSNESQKEKLVKRFMSKGFSYNLIKASMEELWKN